MSEKYFLRDWNPSFLVLADEINHRFNSIHCSCSALVEGGRTVNAAGEGEENLKNNRNRDPKLPNTHKQKIRQ